MPAAYQSLVQKWGTLCPAISPALLAAQLYQESGWNPKAQSPAAAQGIAQFIPGTWATHGVDGNGDGKADVWDPEDAIPSAASYDCELAQVREGRAGRRHPQHAGRLQRGRLRVIQYNGVPPYRETQNYVKLITTLAKSFEAPVGRVAPSSRRRPQRSTTRRRSSARRICGAGRARRSRTGGSTVRG